MGDLEAELARFEAELAAVPSGPMAPPVLPPPTLPPPTLPPPHGALPPPTLPPPGMPAPVHNESARAHALKISGEEAFRRRALLGGGGSGGPPPPHAGPRIMHPQHAGLGAPPGPMMGGPPPPGMMMGGPPPPGMMMGGPPPPLAMPPPQPYGAGMFAPPPLYPQPPVSAPPQPQMDPATAQAAGAAAIAQGLAAAGKKKGVTKVAIVRQAAGERWVDPNLAEWPDNDFRIFVGNLGNEVTDAVLTAAFSKYSSFQKARVVRSPHNNKTKGYGFVSLSDNEEGARALREMQGKYIGNRPCQLKRSSWADRNVVDRKTGKAKKRTVEIKEKPVPIKRPATAGGILHR